MKIFVHSIKRLYRINIITLSFVITVFPYLSINSRKINSQNIFAIIFLRRPIILLTDEYPLEKNMMVLN